MSKAGLKRQSTIVVSSSTMGALIVLAAIGSILSSSEPLELTPVQIRDDFAVFISEVKSTYAYFDAKKTQWDSVGRLYESDLKQVRTREDFVQLLELVINELYDDHAHLTVNTPTSPLLVPSGTDVWASWVGSDAIVSAVRPGSHAERAGLREGAVVTAINDVPSTEAADRLIGRSVPKTDPAVRDWALRHALAGRRGSTHRIEAVQGGRRMVFELRSVDVTEKPSDVVSFSRLPGNVGYIRFNDSLGGNSTVTEFDHALAALRDTRGLVLDLRDTPSGGNSTVARGILGRFVKREMPYQKHVLTAEERETSVRRSWIELVSPRGPFMYTKRVAVLVGRWTGSMGEGLAIGFDAAASTITVGSPMAQLLGATYRIELPNSKIGVSVPAEQLYHVNGTPREAFNPEFLVANGSPESGDAVLRAGVRAVLSGRTGPDG